MNPLRSIRTRLTLWYTLALVALLTVAFLGIYLLARGQLYGSFDRSLREELQQVAGVTNRPEYGLGMGDHRPTRNGGIIPDEFRRPNAGPNDNVSGELVLIYRSGQLQEQYGATMLTATQVTQLWQATAETPQSVDLGNDLKLRAMRSRPGNSGLTAIVARPVAPIDAPLGNMLLAFFLVMPFAVLAAAGGGLFIASRALRPIKTMDEAAREISSHDLSRRLALGPPRDELTGLASTIDAMLGRIEAGVEQQRRFTADASHELRTPLTVIASEAELALTRPRSAAEYRESLQTIARESDEMRGLVEDLLTLARSDAGRLQLTQQPLDLASVAVDTVARIDHKAAAADVRLELQGAEQTLRVCADARQLGRLLLNLLDNAIKYSPPGSTVSVILTSAASPMLGETISDTPRHVPLAALSVCDAGAGIDATHLPYLFDRFYRADAARHRDERSGTGLGLAISAAIAHAHKGWLGVASTPGQGSRFTLYLPLLVNS